jgi:hypothetical protein
MPEPTFRRIQYAFAAHIRDPGQHPAPPDVRPERMAIYRELFLNNVKNFIGTGFPVLKAVLDEAHWHALVEDFFARHRSTTPYYADFPEEFLAFLSQERAGRPEDPPFLLELAHYEWVELALALAAGEPPEARPECEQDPLACAVALSDVAWPLAYRFPVQRIGRDYRPAEPPTEPTCLIVYRDRDDRVRFMETNPATYQLLHRLEETGPQAADACLRGLAEALGLADPAPVLEHGAQTLRELARRGVVGLSPRP